VDQFTGSIDEVAVYSSALSQTRVQAHYLLGRSYQDSVLDSGPVSYWRLGEGSGTSAADSKGSNTGTYTNGPTLAQAGALAGDADTASGFDGTNDYVNVPWSAALNPAQYTVEFWARATGGANTWRTAASTWQQNGADWQGYALGLDDTNHWMAQTGNGTVAVAITGPSVVYNSWTHVVETYDGATLRMYVNGASAGSLATTSYTPAPSPMAFEIGAEYSGGTRVAFFPGQIDDVALYNKALSATEVQLHYDSGRQ
jgi:Concanavalin A-like lectin/glucanases superfamily